MFALHPRSGPRGPDARPSRRSFCATAAGIACGAALARPTWAAEPPPVTNPRATDGDQVHEPDWAQRMTLTVGPANADLVGRDDKAIQAALDYLARLGGGTVQLLPGTYTLRNAIFLPSGSRLAGSGTDSVITKIASQTVALADDSDWYDQEITLKGAAGFQVGDGVVLRATNPHHGGLDVIKRTLVASSGSRFKLNDGIRKNLWLTGKPTCASLFPLLTSQRTAGVVIENLTLDGNRENNDHLDGNHAGGIFLQDCNRYVIRNVTARNYNGDGISFQICHDVVVENCHSHGNADLGVHPGSGSQRPRILHNQMENNRIGLFWCWGVKFGLAEGNRIAGNRDYGISVGHCDTDNVMRENTITGSGKVGILFRDAARGRDFWANRNVVENNRIIDSGGPEGVGIDIQGQTKDVQILHNVIRETRAALQRTAIRIGSQAQRITVRENQIDGFAADVVDGRKGAS